MNLMFYRTGALKEDFISKQIMFSLTKHNIQNLVNICRGHSFALCKHYSGNGQNFALMSN